MTAGTATLQLTTNTARVFANIAGTPVVQNDSLELVVNTSHDLQGTINNPPPGVSITVTVDGRTAPVAFSWRLGSIKPWYGFLSLAGLAPGTKTARIDMTAPEGTFTRSFTFNYQP